MGAFAFANAGMLAALIALPAIWYFLRLMPPKPRLERFPPTRLLLEITRKEEQPSRSPWWLTAIRLGLAAAVIFALAGPVFKPTGEVAPGSGPLLMVVDNGWTAAPTWEATMATAHRIVALAAEESRPIALIATAEPASQSLAPTDPGEIDRRLDALAPRPWTADAAALVPPLTTAARATAFGGVAWLSDGVGGPGIDALGKALTAAVSGPLLVYTDTTTDLAGLKPPVGTADALKVPVVRRAASAPAAGLVRAIDSKGRVIGEVPYSFSGDETETSASFTLPVELRNDIARVEIAGSQTAGAVQLLDDRWRRRRVGLLSGTSAEAAQPLLSPLYYISRALQPFADIQEPRDANAAKSVPELIDGGASVIVMADIGKLTADTEQAVSKWVQNGGVLVRFAGPRLAAATDTLIPVLLRQGDRVLGGSLSWQTPQPLASFNDKSPFAGLTVPGDVLVKRQVLAEPDATLSDHTWAALADGTPLVTAAQSGKGWLVLFHVTADTSWSNLPLSGTFVEMLRRIVDFSSGTGAADATSQPVAPYKLLDGYGRFTTPTADAEAIAGKTADVVVGRTHPPGLYGTEDGFVAVNLLGDTATLPPFAAPAGGDVTVRAYPTASPTDLAPWLIALALLLLAADTLAVLWLNGGLRWRRPARAAAAVMVGLVAGFGLLAGLQPARADAASDAFAMAAADETHLAYVITGDADTDATSKAGLAGLTRVLANRTALEPGDPIGVDPAKDELAFFPLLYWPVVASAPMPSPATMARIDAYMRQGGSVLFDTRDQLDRATANAFSGTPAAERLRAMLSGLDIPPLEPVPADHVLTKTFYLLNEFPGRYTGGALWVQSTDPSEARADRPVQAGDGVSPILITENDFAGAWAIDDTGRYLFPTVPNDQRQREFAYRAGINIVMYTLTGNYKSDQVHVPALLERLGQ